jgi:hypothetical protein
MSLTLLEVALHNPFTEPRPNPSSRCGSLVHKADPANTKAHHEDGLLKTLEHLERDKRFELSTYTLARYRSTN